MCIRDRPCRHQHAMPFCHELSDPCIGTDDRMTEHVIADEFLAIEHTSDPPFTLRLDHIDHSPAVATPADKYE